MENNFTSDNVKSELLNEISRPCVDNDHVCFTNNHVKILDCVVLDNGNIKGITDNGVKALYKFDNDTWYFGKDIAKLNLISLSDRTLEERQKIGSIGGIKAKENREQKKNINELAKAMLEQTMTEKQIQTIMGNDSNVLLDNSVASVMLGAMIKSALNGSFKAFESVRDTAGYRPKDISSVELSANVITESDKALIDKALKSGWFNNNISKMVVIKGNPGLEYSKNVVFTRVSRDFNYSQNFNFMNRSDRIGIKDIHKIITEWIVNDH